MLKTENDEQVTSADLTAVLHISSAGYRLCVLEDAATALPSKAETCLGTSHFVLGTTDARILTLPRRQS